MDVSCTVSATDTKTAKGTQSLVGRTDMVGTSLEVFKDKQML